MLTKERILKILGAFWGRILVILFPIIWLVINKICFGPLQEIMLIKEYILFSPKLFQEIWGIQLTVSAAVISICLFFLDNGHKRRLGLSYKYIFFHDDIFGKNNVMYLSCMNLVILIYEFICAYFILEIKDLGNSQLIQLSLIISIGMNTWQTIRLMNLFVIAKYKESVINEKIRDLAKNGKDSLFSKMKEGAGIEYKQTIENEEYDQYFGDAVFTLFIVLKKVDENDKKLYLKCIAAKIFQYERYFKNKQWSSIQDADDFMQKFSKFIMDESKADNDNNDETNEKLLESIKINENDYNYIKSKVKRIRKHEKKRINRLR